MSTSTARHFLVGIGNAGVSVLDRIALENPSLKGLLVVNGDEDSLNASVVANRIVFPSGDFADGFLAIEEEFGHAIHGASSVILCGALGGELGSFLIPALAARAKAHGITTIASVGIPFSFEGRQKKESADAALRKLHDLCDAVAVIDNDRLSGGVPSSAAVGEAFVAADRALQSSLMALRGMLLTSGPVRITRHDLMTTLGTHGAMTHFAHGRASGANRLHEALEQALKSTLLLLPGKGPVLREASSVLVLLSGPSDLSFAEVQRAVSEVERLSMERCQVKVGVRAESSPEAPLEIFLLTSSGGTPRIPEAPANGTPRHLERKPEEISPGEKFAATARSSKTSKPGGTTAVKQTQGVLDLESYQRGRFDKSEPTIVAGEDLDIPTFFRKGIKLPAPSKH